MKEISYLLVLFFSFCQLFSNVTPQSIKNSGNERLNLINKPSKITHTTISSIKSGDWVDPTTWNTNQVPNSGDYVSINSGHVVNLTGDVSVASIMVMGTLKPLTPTTNFNISTRGILVMGGLLEIGTPANPYTAEAIITLTGSDKNEELFHDMGHSMGTKLIGSMDGGIIRMHGLEKKSWTKLDANAAVGTTQIKVNNLLQWKVGDEILIVSSRLNWNEAEKRTITSIDSNNNLVFFSQPLSFPHSGTQETHTRATDNRSWTADLRAEVGMLSHNIKIQGDASSESNDFGGHMMIHNNSFGYI